jgi:prepilin-type N-terminal cleavage/methylation domain-containing protein
MVKSQKGFTIIELVVVIVILGILSAVAFPKFQDLTGDAKLAVTKGAAAALQSAAVITFAKNSGNKQSLVTIQAQVTPDTNITYGGTCAAATATYVGTAIVTTVNLTEYCN